MSQIAVQMKNLMIWLLRFISSKVIFMECFLPQHKRPCWWHECYDSKLFSHNYFLVISFLSKGLLLKVGKNIPLWHLILSYSHPLNVFISETYFLPSLPPRNMITVIVKTFTCFLSWAMRNSKQHQSLFDVVISL